MCDPIVYFAPVRVCVPFVVQINTDFRFRFDLLIEIVEVQCEDHWHIEILTPIREDRAIGVVFRKHEALYNGKSSNPSYPCEPNRRMFGNVLDMNELNRKAS